MGTSLLGLALLMGTALPVVALAAWRPAAGCALLAILVPLTGGIPRDTVIPFLRPSEALTLVVATGLFIFMLLTRRRLMFVGLDLVILCFVLVEVFVPLLMLLVRQVHVDLETWRTVLGPFQYLAVYLVFSRSDIDRSSLRWIVNMAFVASIVVAAVAVLEVISPSFHTLVSTYYEESPTASWDPVYRPSSLVTHYSAVGGFALLSGILAASLLVVRHRDFPAPWLGLVVLANAAGLFVSQTWAPLLALPVVAVVIMLYARRIPWRPLVLVAGVAATGLLLFWPLVTARIDQQGLITASGGLALPATVETRLRYWEEFFIPAALDNLWLGTGTSTVAGGYPTPSEVPESLTKFIDNEYIYEVLRAGILALVMLLVLFVALARAGWQARASPDPSVRALGATCLASVLALLITGLTSEYLTFSALTQLFWMQVALLVAMRTPELGGRLSVLTAPGGSTWRPREAHAVGA